MARNDVYGHIRVLDMKTGALVFSVDGDRSKRMGEITKPLGLTMWASRVDVDEREQW